MDAVIAIEFDQPKRVYFSGQIVAGKVDIILPEPKTIQGIQLTIHGFGKTEWYKGKDKKTNGTPDYSGFEEYLLINTCLLQSTAGNSIELEAGRQTHQFHHQLPENLPSSYEGMFGHVRYVVKIELEGAGNFKQSSEEGFTVYKTIDLDRDSPQWRLPIEAENQKSYCCGYCKTQPLILKASLPKAGFVPGEIVPVKIDISTKSIEVLEIRLYLRKLVIYRAEQPMVTFKEDCVELVHKTSGHLQSGSASKFEEKLMIPSVPPSTLLYSKIIQINYDVKIEAVIGEQCEKLVVLCPFTVGSTHSLLNRSNATIVPVHEIAMRSSLTADTSSSYGQLSVELAPPEYSREGNTRNALAEEAKKVAL